MESKLPVKVGRAVAAQNTIQDSKSLAGSSRLQVDLQNWLPDAD